MSKKRRTRAQKVRSALRRHQDPLVTAPTAAAETKPVEARPVRPVDRAEPAPAPSSDEVVQSAPVSAKPASDLRLSLAIFGSLIALQLSLWLIFGLTDLDTKLYKLFQF